MFKYNQNLL